MISVFNFKKSLRHKANIDFRTGSRKEIDFRVQKKQQTMRTGINEITIGKWSREEAPLDFHLVLTNGKHPQETGGQKRDRTSIFLLGSLLSLV